MSQGKTRAHSIRSGIINGQGVQPFSPDKLGISNYAKSGCCMIATYNMMQLLGRDMSLGEVADQYVGGPCGSIFGGLWGAGPWNAGRFLRRFLKRSSYQGYFRVKKLDRAVQEGDILLFFMMNHRFLLTRAFHCMAGRYKDGKFELYNVSNSCKVPCTYQKLRDKTKQGHFLYGYLIRPEAEA